MKNDLPCKQITGVYYEYYRCSANVKRLVKVTALIAMLTEKRGVVIDCKVEPLDVLNEYEYDFVALRENEIGKGKNIVSLYAIVE